LDIYQKIKPHTSDKELVKVGRITTAVVVILGMAWIPVMRGISDTLYQYLQSVQSYLAPPIAAVFLLGVFSKRINGKGAITTMVVGFIIGVLRIVLELTKNHLSGILYTFATINFLYFCIFLFVFSIALLIIVSLSSEKPSEVQLNGLTYATTVAEDKATSRASWNATDVVLSAIVVLIIVCVFLYFSPLGVAG
jgi:SSS family solute:Na+ symporter